MVMIVVLMLRTHRPAVFTRHIDVEIERGLVEIERGEPTLVDTLYVECKRRHRQFAKFSFERVERQAGIDEGTEDHVAARAREAIEIRDLHADCAFMLAWLTFSTA